MLMSPPQRLVIKPAANLRAAPLFFKTRAKACTRDPTYHIAPCCGAVRPAAAASSNLSFHAERAERRGGSLSNFTRDFRERP